MTERRRGLPALETQATVVGADRYAQDISGESHVRVAFVDLDLTEVQNRGAGLARCDLRGSDLSAVEPEHVELQGAIVTADQALVIAATLGLDIHPE